MCCYCTVQYSVEISDTGPSIVIYLCSGGTNLYPRGSISMSAFNHAQANMTCSNVENLFPC